MPSRMIGTNLALVAFAVALLMGLAAGNPALTILWNAFWSMVICYYIGQILGYVAQKAVDENVEQFKAEHPIVQVTSLNADTFNNDDSEDDTIIAQPVEDQYQTPAASDSPTAQTAGASPQPNSQAVAGDDRRRVA